jgi:hypothetical protein
MGARQRKWAGDDHPLWADKRDRPPSSARPSLDDPARERPSGTTISDDARAAWVARALDAREEQGLARRVIDPVVISEIDRILRPPEISQNLGSAGTSSISEHQNRQTGASTRDGSNLADDLPTGLTTT